MKTKRSLLLAVFAVVVLTSGCSLTYHQKGFEDGMAVTECGLLGDTLDLTPVNGLIPLYKSEKPARNPEDIGKAIRKRMAAGHERAKMGAEHGMMMKRRASEERKRGAMERERIMKWLDKDGDGKISERERAAAERERAGMAERMRGAPEPARGEEQRRGREARGR